MKNFILKTLLIIAIILLIAEIEKFTIGVILIKVISLMYIAVFLKANNYFNK